jgi:hypothetical protein
VRVSPSFKGTPKAVPDKYHFAFPIIPIYYPYHVSIPHIPQKREFYLYAIKKVDTDLCATEKLVHTFVPFISSSVSSMPFCPCSIQFLPFGDPDMWDLAEQMSILPASYCGVDPLVIAFSFFFL